MAALSRKRNFASVVVKFFFFNMIALALSFLLDIYMYKENHIYVLKNLIQ